MTPSDDPTTNSETPPEKTVSANFIRQIIDQDLAAATHGGRVQTRFPPEPNGYLHIGHAKSICLNFGVALETGGYCNLRFDDTNPEKESQEYVDAIKSGIQWLGFQWHEEVRYSSAYFDALYDFAVQLIKKGKAYVCGLSPDEAREYRGTLTSAGIDSPDRDRSVQQSLELFSAMRAGDFAEGELSLRAKIDMTSPNINMRDPVIYRIRHIAHHQTGDKWKIYPSYDFTHGISDALECVTHSLCTLEFEDHRPLYEWILNCLELESLHKSSSSNQALEDYVLPRQIEFARLNISYTVLSKRKLRQLVTSGLVNGWDDPRMPTLAGLRRRGYTPASIRNFCERVGVTRSEGIVDVAMLEFSIREDLDKTSPRAMCVLEPLKVVITNYSKEHSEEINLACHPKEPKMCTRKSSFAAEIFIERSDFEEIPPPKYKRLTPGKEVRLRGAYVIRCDEVVKDDSGVVVELRCSYDAETLGKKPEGRKVKGVIHWVPARDAIEVEVRLYDRLFNKKNPEDKRAEDFQQCINSDSLRVLKNCLVEPSLANASAESRFQFERIGYFSVDQYDSTAEKLVFNRTVSLRDSWAKIAK